MSQATSNEAQLPSGGDKLPGRKREADDMAAIVGQIPLNDDRRDNARREYHSLRTTTNRHTIDNGIWLDILEEMGHKQKNADTYTSFKHTPFDKLESTERRYERRNLAREIEDEIGIEHKYYTCIPPDFRNPHFMPQSILDCSTTSLKAIAAGLKRPPKTDSGSGVHIPANAHTEAGSQQQPIDLCTPKPSPSPLTNRETEALLAPKKEEPVLPASGFATPASKKRKAKDVDRNGADGEQLSPGSAKLKWEKEGKILEAKQALLNEAMHQHNKQKPN